MNWTAPLKPAVFAEQQLIDAILDGHFPIDSSLPAERELAAQMGVTRPTLREALQRLARDGWIEIQHGKSTRVRNYWQEGNLAVLGSIARQSENLPPEFVPNLLFVRYLLAPTYTRLAIENHPADVLEVLHEHIRVQEAPQDFSAYDWRLHHKLTIASGNPVFTLILNGFRDLYQTMACIYFANQQARMSSRQFYSDLLEATLVKNASGAETITRQVMGDSLALWQLAIGIPKGD